MAFQRLSDLPLDKGLLLVYSIDSSTEEGEAWTMEIDLMHEKQSLEAKIDDLESRMAPIQKELKELRERLVHVKALIPEEQTESGSSSDDELPYGFWVKSAGELGLVVGGDSAHRVVKRKAPDFHNSISHQCKYDGRRYP